MEVRVSTRPAGKTQCHITNNQGIRCTGEVMDPMAEIGMCTRHTAALLEYAVRIKARIISSKGATS